MKLKNRTQIALAIIELQILQIENRQKKEVNWDELDRYIEIVIYHLKQKLK